MTLDTYGHYSPRGAANPHRNRESPRTRYVGCSPDTGDHSKWIEARFDAFEQVWTAMMIATPNFNETKFKETLQRMRDSLEKMTELRKEKPGHRFGEPGSSLSEG
jgi:hypothetical protein